MTIREFQEASALHNVIACQGCAVGILVEADIRRDLFRHAQELRHG